VNLVQSHPRPHARLLLLHYYRTLVGQGAYEFAVKYSNNNTDTTDDQPLPGHIIRVSPEELIAPRARQEWQYWTQRLKEAHPDQPLTMEDTVGAAVMIGGSSSTSAAAGVSRLV
jgi:hypothetical protein